MIYWQSNTIHAHQFVPSLLQSLTNFLLMLVLLVTEQGGRSVDCWSQSVTRGSVSTYSCSPPHPENFLLHTKSGLTDQSLIPTCSTLTLNLAGGCFSSWGIYTFKICRTLHGNSNSASEMIEMAFINLCAVCVTSGKCPCCPCLTTYSYFNEHLKIASRLDAKSAIIIMLYLLPFNITYKSVGRQNSIYSTCLET